MKKTLLISTGGTFNKYYHPTKGELCMDEKSSAIKEIADRSLCQFELMCIIGKDSLDMDNDDRVELLHTIMHSSVDDIIVIHGTDTMDISAEFIASKQLSKRVIFTGAMVPYSIDPVEATGNLMLAYGYLQAQNRSGVYIAMNGIVDSHEYVIKDKDIGKFIAREK